MRFAPFAARRKAVVCTDMDYACGGLGVFMKPQRYLSVCSGSIQRITRALDSLSRTCERRSLGRKARARLLKAAIQVSRQAGWISQVALDAMLVVVPVDDLD